MTYKLRTALILDPRTLTLKGKGKGVAVYEFDGNRVNPFGRFLFEEGQGNTGDFYFGIVHDSYHPNRKPLVLVKITVDRTVWENGASGIDFFPGNDPRFFDSFDDFSKWRMTLMQKAKARKEQQAQQSTSEKSSE